MKTTAKGNIYRGPSTSQEYNEDYNNIADDIQQLFTDVNEEIEQKNTIVDVLTKENVFLYNKIASLHAKYTDLKAKVDDIMANIDSGIYRMSTIFTSLNNIQDMSNVDIDPIYRYATLKETGLPISRTHLTSGTDIYIPDDLRIEITESDSLTFSATPTLSSTSDDTLFNIIDPDAINYFKRDVATDDGNKTLYIQVKIKVPLAFVNSLFANELLITPFPSYTMSLHSLTCKNTSGSTVTLLSYSTPQQEIGKTSLRFDVTQGTEYTLVFSQKPIQENGQWKFTYGFQYIDILYNEILVQEGSFTTKFTVPSGYFATVNKPSVTSYSAFSQAPTETLVDYKLYYDSALQVERRFGEQILAQINTVYIKTIIKRSAITNSAPVLSGYTFTYLKQDS